LRELGRTSEADDVLRTLAESGSAYSSRASELSEPDGS
jgi:hypothetical protein